MAGGDIVRTATAEATGDRFDPATFDRYRGASKHELLTALVGPDDADHAHTRFERHLRTAIDAYALHPLPGAEQCLRDLKAREVRTCLITGFSRPVREALVSHLGWDALVDLALSPEDAGRGRPAPDLVLTAALRLTASDVRAVAVAGDTTNDLVAAHRAGSGIRAGVLTGAHNAETLRTAPHTHILTSIADLIPAIDHWTT